MYSNQPGGERHRLSEYPEKKITCYLCFFNCPPLPAWLYGKCSWVNTWSVGRNIAKDKDSQEKIFVMIESRITLSLLGAWYVSFNRRNVIQLIIFLFLAARKLKVQFSKTSNSNWPKLGIWSFFYLLQYLLNNPQ